MTVFVPTNAAFDRLPAWTVDMLLKPESKDKLKTALTYHVEPGRMDTAALRAREGMGQCPRHAIARQPV